MEVRVPVPGSQVVGFRPFLDYEERLYREKPKLEPVEEKWPLAATLRFVVVSGVVLWAAIGFIASALF
jgi:hypothetical protein